MPAPRDNDLAVLTYHRHTVVYAGVGAVLAGVAIGFDRTQVTSPLTAVLGIAESDMAPGATGSLAVAGVCQMLSGGAVAIGAPVTADPTGRAFPAALSQQIFGRALSAATVAGQKIQVLITREGAA